MKKNNEAQLTIFWPDAQWEEDEERRYLVACLRDVATEIEERGSRLKLEQQPMFFNTFGRQYAALGIEKS